MTQVAPIFKREFLGYFRSPVAYVFLIGFLATSVGLSFFLGGFFKAGNASLERYFMFLPWVFVILVPAVCMRLWAEERRAGTIELMFTLPVTTLEAVLGKFLAAWAFISVAILLSFPMALTVGYLGNPDWGVMLVTYFGACLMAASYVGVCSLTSAFTKNQVISFVISFGVCIVMVFLGWSIFNEVMERALPVWAVDLLANFSFITHFEAFMKGIIDPKDVIFFLSLTGLMLFLNVVALER